MPGLPAGGGHQREELPPEAVRLERPCRDVPKTSPLGVARALDVVRRPPAAILQREPLLPALHGPRCGHGGSRSPEPGPRRGRTPARSRVVFSASNRVARGNQPEAGHDGHDGLHAVRILDGAAQHLEAPAHAQDHRGRRGPAPCLHRRRAARWPAATRDRPRSIWSPGARSGPGRRTPRDGPRSGRPHRPRRGGDRSR